MISGSPFYFAIESEITRAYAMLGARALGFFVLHIAGERYGVRAPDASLLACSLEEVEARLARRGTHTAAFATDVDSGRIADAYRDALYARDQEEQQFFGMPQPEFSHLIYSKHIIWAPDGDEAFDDSSHVLHFDVGQQVRLIGFRCVDGYHHDPKTLRDIVLPAADFYGILERWRSAFIEEWKNAPKHDDEDLTVPTS